MVISILTKGSSRGHQLQVTEPAPRPFLQNPVQCWLNKRGFLHATKLPKNKHSRKVTTVRTGERPMTDRLFKILTFRRRLSTRGKKNFFGRLARQRRRLGRNFPYHLSCQAEQSEFRYDNIRREFQHGIRADLLRDRFCLPSRTRTPADRNVTQDPARQAGSTAQGDGLQTCFANNRRASRSTEHRRPYHSY